MLARKYLNSSLLTFVIIPMNLPMKKLSAACQFGSICSIHYIVSIKTSRGILLAWAFYVMECYIEVQSSQ
ncbi:MAG: hypothetical protein AAGA66_04650 [Bacteroidota bacterium]